MNNGIKYKQAYIFLKKKKLIFNIKLNITLKSHETFINQNAKNQKIEEQRKNHKTRETIKQNKTEEEEKNRETIQQS